MWKIFKIIVLIIILSAFAGYYEYSKWKAYNDGLLHLYYLNVGQGDSFLIKTPDNKTILIDGGAGRDVVHRMSDILPFWIDKIDLIIVSHSHVDHITGVIEVIKGFKIGCIIYRDIDPANTENEEILRAAIKSNRLTHVLPNNANSCLQSSVSIQNYVPGLSESYNSTKMLKDQNFESIVTWVRYKDFDALFTADSTIEAQQKLINTLNTNFEVIKAAHQGSKLSLNRGFVRKINPEIVVVSVGPNSYGHPHRETLDFYNSAGIKIYRTDESKSYVDVISDGETFEVRNY